jgi:hypothetical protein
MWTCSICGKNKVIDKGKGFRVFIEYNVLSILDLKNKDREKIDMWGTCKRQIRVCEKCLKKDLETIKL